VDRFDQMQISLSLGSNLKNMIEMRNMSASKPKDELDTTTTAHDEETGMLKPA